MDKTGGASFLHRPVGKVGKRTVTAIEPEAVRLPSWPTEPGKPGKFKAPAAEAAPAAKAEAAPAAEAQQEGA